MPQIRMVMTMETAFRARALVETQEPGGSSKAARTAKTLMSAAKWHRPRSVFSYLAGRASERNAVGIVAEVAGGPGFDALAARAILDGRLRLLAAQSEIPCVLRGERAWLLGHLKRWLEGSPKALDGWDAVWPTRRHFYKDAMRYLDVTESAVWALSNGDQEAVDRTIESAHSMVRAFSLTRSASSTINNLRYRRTEHTAAMNLARVALAVLEAKQETSVWPPDLDEIRDRFDDGLPLDPFTNAPFVYERTEVGVRLAASPSDAAKRYPNPADMEAYNLVWNLRDG